MARITIQIPIVVSFSDMFLARDSRIALSTILSLEFQDFSLGRTSSSSPFGKWIPILTLIFFRLRHDRKLFFKENYLIITGRVYVCMRRRPFRFFIYPSYLIQSTYCRLGSMSLIVWVINSPSY